MSYSTSPHDYTHGYSTLEVDDQRLPEIDSNPPIAPDYPEVVPSLLIHQGEKQAGPSLGEGTAERTLCGLRKRTFWIVAGITIVIIVGIIAGTVGGVLSSRKNQNSSGDTANVTDTPDNREPDATAILPTTRIASANFVDAYGNDNYLVIYQLNSRAIYLSAWNSSYQQWVVSPLLDGTTRDSLDEIRQGTALSIDVYRHSDEQRDVHIYWQSTSDTVRSIMYSSNITTDKVIPLSGWEEKYRREDFTTAGPGASIVSYARQCDYCAPWTYYFCQTPAGRLSGAFRTPTANDGSPGWEFIDFVNGIGLAAANTSLAAAPAAATNETGRSINLFFQSDSGVLTQIVYDGAAAYGHSALDRANLRPRASIVAFSTGLNDTGLEDPAESLGFQVLTVDRDEASGIFSTYFGEGAWAAGEKVEALIECSARGSMAANQGRRVYCVHDVLDGKVEIIEWAWEGDVPGENTNYTNYRRIGPVGTKAQPGL